MTVSMALSGHPSIPEKTRSRIREIAEKLGYVPDPMLTALATYRHGRQPAGFRGTLAWLAQTTERFQWRKIPHFIAYHEAAAKRAESHGYKLETIDIHELGIAWKRAAAIAKSRGIGGIILCPQPLANTAIEDFDWSSFAAVTIGHSVLHPKLNRVAPAQYAAGVQTMREVIARGYRRIGFIIDHDVDRRTNHHFLSAYLSSLHLHTPRPDVPPLIAHDAYTTRKSVWRWIKEQAPDAIVTCDDILDQLALERGIRIPEDIGMANPMLPPSPRRSMSGVIENDHKLGEVAVDFLVAAVQRGECGIPDMPQQLLVEGAWSPGRTLRSLPND